MIKQLIIFGKWTWKSCRIFLAATNLSFPSFSLKIHKLSSSGMQTVVICSLFLQVHNLFVPHSVSHFSISRRKTILFSTTQQQVCVPLNDKIIAHFWKRGLEKLQNLSGHYKSVISVVLSQNSQFAIKWNANSCHWFSSQFSSGARSRSLFHTRSFISSFRVEKRYCSVRHVPSSCFVKS